MVRRLRKVKCVNCRKPFYKNKWHAEENLKLGHNFYCSPRCFSAYRKTGKWLLCGNDLCKEGFYRTKHAISRYNYCSQSCAATVNNYKFPKWPARYCRICKRVVKREGTPYCSPGCGKAGKFKYNKKEILGLVRKYHDETGRVPAKRELLDVSNKAANLFGSWNKTLIAAGLVPNRSHDHRMYKRVITKAKDGHVCDSISEAIVDNWLSEHTIPHERNVSYPGTQHKADWALDKNLFVEYFGLAKDSPRYDRDVRKKRRLCRKSGIQLVEITAKDLYPIKRIEHKLGDMLPGKAR